jgi:hypothetical protein
MKTMRKLLVVLPLLLGLVVACDSTRRDFTYCDTTYSKCGSGRTCNQTTGLCEPDVDAGPPDTRVIDAWTPPDVSVSEAASTPDTKDAPVGIDTASLDSAVVDTSIVDVPPLVVDAYVPDAFVPDASGTCSVDNDCVGVAAGAYCLKAKCVGCKTNSQCNNDKGVPFCSAQNTCVSCAAVSGADGGSACPAATPACAASGGCVQCVTNSDCPTAGKSFCVQNQCKGCDSVVAGASSTDGGAPDGGATGPCTGATPICVLSTNTTNSKAGQCVGCQTSTDCSGNTPICDTTTGTFKCGACTSDDQCLAAGVGPGICMLHQGGRCATSAETIYVKNSSGCTGGAGTLASPYCQPQAAVDAVKASTNQRLIVMVGTGTSAGVFGIWTASFTAGTSQVSIIGQNNPVIAPGAADIGIHIVSGNVYIRGLTVQGAGASATIAPSQAGIVVDSGATIALDRCHVMGNAGGLLVHNGAGFDVANSVFAANLGGTGDFGSFGGVSLGTAGTGLPTRFWFNTIVQNQQIGVSCVQNSQPMNAVLIDGNIGDSVRQCTVDSNSVTNSNNANSSVYTADYHLKLNSPCRDFIKDLSTPHPVDDIDGQTRPYGIGLDCGADEYP